MCIPQLSLPNSSSEIMEKLIIRISLKKYYYNIFNLKCKTSIKLKTIKFFKQNLLLFVLN